MNRELWKSITTYAKVWHHPYPQTYVEVSRGGFPATVKVKKGDEETLFLAEAEDEEEVNFLARLADSVFVKGRNKGESKKLQEKKCYAKNRNGVTE